MGKHKDRSRSRSKSKKKKHHHSRSRSKSPRDRQAQEEPRRRRQTKWSDTPLPAPEPVNQPDTHLFDSGLIRIAEPGSISIPKDAININQPQDGGLKMSQKELFEQKLSRQRMGLGYKPPQGGRDDYGMPEEITPGGGGGGRGGGQNPPPINILAPAPGADDNFPQQMNSHIQAALNDPTKIKRKVLIPTDRGFNYAGVIIGPKGSNQKRLEEETGCKILVRGHGSQKDPDQEGPQDEGDPLHVLVVGDTERQVNKAVEEIEKVILADPEVLNEIRQAQLRMVAKLKNDTGLNEDAFKVAVPNDCIGLVIGKGGETIKMLQAESGAKRVQVAPDKGEGMRFLFVEGDEEACMKVKAMIEKIVESHQRVRIARTGLLPNDQPAARIEMPVPDAFVGMVIGKGGANIKEIMHRTGAIINVPPQTESKADRLVTITGFPEAVEKAKAEIEQIVSTGQRNQMVRQMTPIIMQNLMAMNMAAMGYDPYNQNPNGPSVDPVMMNAMYQGMMENMQNMEQSVAGYYMQMMAAQGQQGMNMMDPAQMQQMMMMQMMQQGQQPGGMPPGYPGMPPGMPGMPGMPGQMMPGGQPPSGQQQ